LKIENYGFAVKFVGCLAMLKRAWHCADFVDLERDSAIQASLMALAAYSVRLARTLKIPCGKESSSSDITGAA